MTGAASAKSSLNRFGMDFPYLLGEWRAMLSGKTLWKDVWAGVTVALVALPLNLALAIAAGVEPGVGITTGIIAAVVAALFGGQRVAVTGPAAAMAVVLIEISQTYGIKAVWLVGFIAGALQLLAGGLRLGRLISYIPMPVMVGFANAIGVLVFSNAIDDFLGLPTKPIAHAGQAAPFAGHPLVPEFIQDMSHVFWRVIMHGEVNWLAVAIGGLSFTIAALSSKYIKAVPGQLIAIVVATGVAFAMQLEVPRIHDISTIPNTLPMPALPDLPWEQTDVLFPFALTVFMLGSIESLLSASVADGMTMSRRHNSDQELMGQGLANLVVPFFGGIPVTGVIARTAVSIRAGAQTRLAAIVHSLVLTALIFFLARGAEQIPLAALSAILLLTGIRLIEWDESREIWKASRIEGYVMALTTFVSVLIDLSAGVMTGLVLTCGMFIRQMSDVKLVPAVESDEEQAPFSEGIPSCKLIRTFLVDGPLFFGAAERFIENILVVQDLKVLILHMRSVSVLDITGVETLLSIQRQLERQGARLVLAELPPQPRQLLEAKGALDKIGADNIYSSYRDALIENNRRMLDSTCRACAEGKGAGQQDCRLRIAMHTAGNPVAKLFTVVGERVELKEPLERPGDLNRLYPVESAAQIPDYLRSTPIGTLLRCHNLGEVSELVSDDPHLLVGMCIDYRKYLYMPKEYAYVIRREGANMRGAEFAMSMAMMKGIKYMALIAHNQCAMSNTKDFRDAFITNLMERHGWSKVQASQFFDDNVRSKEINNEIDFVLGEAARLARIFRGLTVVPMVYRIENDRLYLIVDWLNKSGRQLKQTAVIPAVNLEN